MKCRTKSKDVVNLRKIAACFDYALALDEYELRKFTAPLSMLCYLTTGSLLASPAT